MAVLDDANRAKVAAQFQRENAVTGTITKPQLRAAVDAADQWIEDNQVSFNNALPVAFRTAAPTLLKNLLFLYVLLRRMGKLRAEGE